MYNSVENKVLGRIYGWHRGYVFTPMQFLDIGSRMAIDQSLVRLTKSGTIRRLSRGLYDYPAKHQDFGNLPPDYERIAQALAKRDNLRIQPSGAYAANLLGLTEQVPAKVVFLTDGPNRKVQAGKRVIVLKRTTPKNMATAGRISGLVIQALRYLKQGNIDSGTVSKIKNRLSEADKKILKKDICYAPAWIGDIINKIQE